MTGKALVCKLGKHQSIEGADNIVKVDMFGETVIVSKDEEEGRLGLLFDSETQLSHKYCHYNNLYRDKTLNYDTSKAGYIEKNRRIKLIKLKGVKVSAFWMPIESLKHFYSQYKLAVNEGTEINSINGIEICRKYINEKTQKQKNQKGKARKNITPTFKEHFDIDQLMRNFQFIHSEDRVIISEKLHGTSGRVGYLPTINDKKWWQFWKSDKPEYKFVVGSRRVVKTVGEEEHGNKNHYYNEDVWTKAANKYFKDKLHKDETVYFEIVGYLPNGKPIMEGHDNKKLKNFMSKEEYKDFINNYGKNTCFNYGCSPDELDVYVYRITMTNSDGQSIDYSWQQLKNRCKELNVKYVPELEIGTVYQIAEAQCNISDNCDGRTNLKDDRNIKELFSDRVNLLANNYSHNFPNHIREGICVRIENERLTPYIFKHKNYYFKVLEGIIKEENSVDIEESN